MSIVDERLCVTCSAPTNIATIKYWGKDSIELNTPINSSVSVTLLQDDLKAVTTIAASRSFDKDRMWLNGNEEEIAQNGRLSNVIKLVREMAADKVDPRSGEIIVRKDEWTDYKVHISSRNTFPTAAGLASSAAGYACLTFTLAQLFNAKESYPGELSAIARQGSGSACRSLHGGFVRWQKGSKLDASDSIAVQIADENHWPELRALIMVVSAAKKDVSSTAGMSTSVETSQLLSYRAKTIVDQRLGDIERAYVQRDFETFGRITMQDSCQFHATCLDTYPPIFYMNDMSRNIIQVIHAYNKHHGSIRAAYTFDAGPNAVIFTTSNCVAELLAVLGKVFPLPENIPLCSDPILAKEAIGFNVPSELMKTVFSSVPEQKVGDVKMVYATRVGDGPRILGPEESMLDLQTGLNCHKSSSNV